MTYTVWSRGRLLGTTELGYARIMPKSRMGDFIPTPLGEQVMPIATGVSPATIDLARHSRATRKDSEQLAPSPGERLDALRQTTEYADLAAAEAHSEALELELRGPDGAVILTESIGIQDTHFLLSLDLAEEFDDDWTSADFGRFDPEREAKLERAIEHDRAILDEIQAGFDDEPDWDSSAESDFPRYQILVYLLDDRSIPPVPREPGDLIDMF